MKPSKKRVLPVDIKLQEGVRFEDGTMFVVLRTLEELELFWREHRDQFEFSCGGLGTEQPCFLREYEWVFGTTKAAVVGTVLRWGTSGIGCEFYDESKDDPRSHKYWFQDRDQDRASQIKAGSWTDDDEKTYQADCARRSPETYRGWWQLHNLPDRYDAHGWFNPAIEHEELFDPHMPIEDAARKLKEQTFDDWMRSDAEEIEYHDRKSLDAVITYWHQVKAAGEDYYGQENERTLSNS
jgi:hypothetical protein